MNSFDEHAAPPPSIMTAAELEMRLRERAKPAPECRLELNTPDGAELRRDAERSNEERIARLQDTLRTTRERSLTAHTFARLQGRVKVDFKRER